MEKLSDKETGYSACEIKKVKTVNEFTSGRKKPKTAGNNSFRKHNRIKFLQTNQRKQLGLSNKT